MQKRKNGFSSHIIELFDNKCNYCNKGSNLEIHHIKPLCEGGTDTLDNLIVLCHLCHVKVHSKKIELPKLFRLNLILNPLELSILKKWMLYMGYCEGTESKALKHLLVNIRSVLK